jgi:hypothetical protein
MAPKKTIKPPKILRPGKKSGSPGSGGLGAYYGGVKSNPALVPGVKEQ